jgi:hypothetical protein
MIAKSIAKFTINVKPDFKFIGDLMKRRTFLSMTIAGAITPYASGLTAAASAGPRDLKTRPESIKEALGALFSDLSAPKAIGDRYLTLHPEKGNLTLLLGDAGLSENMSARSCKEIVCTKRQQDFLHGETITLDGWILAKSEVGVCATLALLCR